jgi:NH3-dependent NAD+ synthetase
MKSISSRPPGTNICEIESHMRLFSDSSSKYPKLVKRLKITSNSSFSITSKFSRKILIPLNTLTKPPSAELRPGQKDADSLPDYAILDQILYLYIEKNQGPNEIISAGFDAALVARILRLVNINEFKRHQTAPVLRISPKAFGMGRRMPIEGKYLNIK